MLKYSDLYGTIYPLGKEDAAMNTFFTVLVGLIALVFVSALIRFIIMVPSILMDLVSTLQEIRDKIK